MRPPFKWNSEVLGFSFFLGVTTSTLRFGDDNTDFISHLSPSSFTSNLGFIPRLPKYFGTFVSCSNEHDHDSVSPPRRPRSSWKIDFKSLEIYFYSACWWVKITKDVLLRQEMLSPGLRCYEWLSREIREEQGACTRLGTPDEIALLALNATIVSVPLLSVCEDVGQEEAVDSLLRGSFTPPPGLSQLLTHRLDEEFTPSPGGRSPMFHSSSLFCWLVPPRRSKHRWAYYIIITIKLMSWIHFAHIHFTPVHRHFAQTQADHRKFQWCSTTWTELSIPLIQSFFSVLIELHDYVATSAAVGVNKVLFKVLFKVTNISLYLIKQC